MQPDPFSAEGGQQNHPEPPQMGSVPEGRRPADDIKSNHVCLCQNVLMRPLSWPWGLFLNTWWFSFLLDNQSWTRHLVLDSFLPWLLRQEHQILTTALREAAAGPQWHWQAPGCPGRWDPGPNVTLKLQFPPLQKGLQHPFHVYMAWSDNWSSHSQRNFNGLVRLVEKCNRHVKSEFSTSTSSPGWAYSHT